MLKELMTQYGKIDILWYDISRPMVSWEGWDSLRMNQMVRELQPDIIINNRSKLEEDFGTPEEKIDAEKGDWEACMTFNGISWGYIDSDSCVPYSYNAHEIIRMLCKVTAEGGNLLLNVGPKPDGSLPDEVMKPLETVGAWLAKNGGGMEERSQSWFIERTTLQRHTGWEQSLSLELDLAEGKGIETGRLYDGIETSQGAGNRNTGGIRSE